MKENYFSRRGLGNELFSKIRFTLILPLITIMGFSHMQAQEMESIPGTIITEPIPIGMSDANSRMAMSQMAPGGTVSAILNRPATADIQLVFGPGAEGNQEVMEAFQFAADIWARELVSNVPIIVMADFANLGAGVLASAGPLAFMQNFPNAPEEDVFYPIALANSLAGEDLAPGTADLVVNLGNGVNFSFGTDGNPPPGTFDFVTIALHELGHGLGFVDGGNVNAAGLGDINGGGNPLIFDLFVTDSQGNSVLDLPNPSTELGDFFVSGDVFVNGEFAVDALDGVLPRLFAPNPFVGGSSIAHWNEATFLAGDPNSLMTPQVAPAESIFDIGEITRGHFRDMGWVLADQSPVNVIPGAITEILNTGDSILVDLTVTNISDGDVNVTVTPSAGAVIIGAIDPATFTLAADGTTTVSVELTAVNALGGFFDEVLTFSAEGSDLTFTVPVSVQVLDGTEVPILTVNPELFDISLEQGTFDTEDLVIGNIGDADLDFTISVDDGIATVENFRSRVNALNSSIAKNGVTTQKIKASNTNSLVAALTPIDGIVNRVVGNLFAEDFEDFQLGNITGQMGWVSQPAGWDISNENPSSGELHIRGTSDGSGTTVQPLALSPLFELGVGTITSMSTRVNIEGSGVSWEFIPQNSIEGSVVTRVRFNGDGTIDVLDNTNGPAFIPLTGVAVPDDYFTLTVTIDSVTLAMDIFIDNEIVFSGVGFATTTNQIVLLSDFAVPGSTFDIDDIDVANIVDENTPFVRVTPTNGTVPFGDDTTLDVLFDARNLEPGVFNATINVASNDQENPMVAIPVTLTVTAPAVIEVNPLSLTAEVDVAVDNPPVAERTFTISNNGGTPLEFNLDIGLPTFTATSGGTSENSLAELDRSIYGGAAKGSFELQPKAAELADDNKLKLNRVGATIANATQVLDSLFLDSGVDFPPAFVGFGPGGPGISTGVMFTVPGDEFVLTAVRNAYQTEDFGSADILLQVYLGGATPDQGELLLEQLITDESVDGTFPIVNLNNPLRFTAGQSFWIVHNYPTGIDFPQGFDDSIATTAPGAYAFTGDGGITFATIDGFAFLTRALSTLEDFITLSPSTGTVASGEEVEVSVSFDGGNLANGVYASDIVVNSNDPINPSVAVATTFAVSGQTSEIAVSDELLLFNDVFVGNSAERAVTLTNTGTGNLSITGITSDNPDFSASPSSATLISGEQLQVVVTYTPSAIGSSNGILSIASDAANESVFEVVLNGVGVEGPFAVLDPEFTQATVVVTESVDVDITLRNEGGSPLTYSFPEFAMAMALADPNTEMQNAEVIDFSSFSPNQSKGFSDTRIGTPVVNVMGTDLDFGYTWMDSDADGGPVNNFFDITGVGQDITALLNNGTFADGTVSLALPFVVPFYGEDQETLFINANGFVAFEAPTGLTFVNGQIPVEDGVNNIIAPFWSDLEPGVGDGGTVHIAAGSNFIIVQWTDTPGFLTTGTVTFQVILFDDGTIDVYYQDMDTASFLANATIGIENTGATDGAQVAFNTAFARDNFAVRFMPPSNILTNFITAATPISGVLGVNQEDTITVTLDGANLQPGVFLDELMVSSNSPDISRSTATFELTVIEESTDPEITFVLINSDTDEAIAPIVNGDVINIADFPGGTNFNIQADTGDAMVGSVVFDFNGTAGFRTESVAPFALGGDNGGDYLPLNIPLGANTVTATAFSESGGAGEMNASATVSFEVVDILPEAEIALFLFNATTDESLGLLQDNPVVDLADFAEGTTFTVEAIVSSFDTGSVIFDLNGVSNFRTENVAPYVLAGGAGSDFFEAPLTLGVNTVSASAFTGTNGNGSAGPSTTLNLEIVDTSSDGNENSGPVSFTLINADTDTAIFELTEGSEINLSDLEGIGLNISALVDLEDVGSVQFAFNDVNNFQTENVAPYALGGDISGDFSAIDFVLGTNTVTAQVFEGANASGAILAIRTINFVVTQVAETVSISMSPNPTSDRVQISLNEDQGMLMKANIVNFAGRTVYANIKLDLRFDKSASLDVSSLPQGLYILVLTDESGTVMAQEKLVKK